MFAHGLSIALLFAIAGEIRQRTGTLAFDELGGLAKVMPFAGLAFGIGVFAAIGLPGFANFAGEIMIFFGAFKNGWKMDGFHIFQIATVLALWGVVISTVYMLRAYRKTFMGTINDQWKTACRSSPGVACAGDAAGRRAALLRIFSAIVGANRHAWVSRVSHDE